MIFQIQQEYLPFHGGPRICIGREYSLHSCPKHFQISFIQATTLMLPATEQFALTEASYTTVRLMQAFPKGFEARDERPWMELLTLTCCINQGTLVGTRT